MAKIEPFKPHFENMRALLARIAEDEEAIGFIGCVIRKDGNIIPVSFEATREQMSYAAAFWLKECVSEGD